MDKSEEFSWLVRIGFAARGMVYMLLGYLALSTASAAQGGAEAAFDFVQEIPFGSVVLYIAAVGLLAYAAFKFLSAVADIEHLGSNPKAIAERTGHFASAIAHLLLAWNAFEFAWATRQSAGSDDGGRQAAGAVLSWELGAVAIGIVGIGFVLGALMQARLAYNGHFMRRISPDAPSAVYGIGRVGHAARAIVFLIIGWSLVKSAWLESQSEVKGLGEALMSLRDDGALYSLVAIGLILFGVFSLIVARYRIIPQVERAHLRPTLD